jgi:hypothetical protein
MLTLSAIAIGDPRHRIVFRVERRPGGGSASPDPGKRPALYKSVTRMNVYYFGSWSEIVT